MEYSPKRGQQGFSMIELLVSMAIGLLILAALLNTFIIQQNTYDMQNQITEAVQTTRAAIDMICREVRMAGYDPTDSGFDGIPYNASQLQILADLDGNGTTTGSNENITYKYEDSQIKRKTGNDDFEPFAENIQNFDLDYLDSLGASTTSTADIRQIKVTITTKTAEADPDYQQNNGYRTVTMTNLVSARNLEY